MDNKEKSMISPSVTDLLQMVDNRYRLVTVTAKRARQLVNKKEILVEGGSYDQPLATAIDEIYEGLVTYETLK